MSNSALILVDIQNDYFENGLWPVAKMGEVGQNAARLLAWARARGDLVVHVRHENAAPGAPFFQPGTPGAEINASVAPEGGEAVLTKARPNSFVGTDLAQRLVKADISKVVICGAMSQMCIDATTRAAADMGYSVTVAQDACGAKEVVFGGAEVPAAQVHAAFMGALGAAYAAVGSTDEIVAE